MAPDCLRPVATMPGRSAGGLRGGNPTSPARPPPPDLLRPTSSHQGTAWSWRIGIPAGFITALMLSVLGLLAGTGLGVLEPKKGIIEGLGVHDRAATEAVDGFAAVLAAVLPPPPPPAAWCGAPG